MSEKRTQSSEDEDYVPVEEGSFTTPAVGLTPPNPSKEQAATPSNTPVVSLFSKGTSNQKGGEKRAFDGAEKSTSPKEVNAMLSKLDIKEKKATGKKKEENEDEEDEDDEDEEDEDDEDEQGEDEDEWIAPKESIDAIVPLLHENQSRLDALQAELLKEMKALSLKYSKLREPIYAQRSNLIRGSSEEGPALVGFWLDAIRRNMLASQFVEEWDEEPLMFLDDVTMKDLESEDENGFELTFHFGKNPFFSNKTLTKKLVINNLYQNTSYPEIDQSIGCRIDWFPNKNLTVKVEVVKVKRAAKGKKAGQGPTREVRTETPQQSFFSFFSSREDLTEEQLMAKDEDAQAEYHHEWEADYALATAFRNKIIPNAVAWYMGEASDSEYDDDEEDEEGDEDDEDDEEIDEDDDDDDDDDDDEDEKPAKRGGGKKASKGGNQAAAGGAGGEEKPECKQQ